MYYRQSCTGWMICTGVILIFIGVFIGPMMAGGFYIVGGLLMLLVGLLSGYLKYQRGSTIKGKKKEVLPKKICQSCGTLLPIELIICPNCGKDQTNIDKFVQIDPKTIPSCPHCGSQQKTYTGFCAACGKNLKKNPQN